MGARQPLAATTQRHARRWTSPCPMAATEGTIFETIWEQTRAELRQGQRYRLFPSPLRLQNQFYNFARRTAACQPPRYIVADRL